jgi:hypothetical protein
VATESGDAKGNGGIDALATVIVISIAVGAVVWWLSGMPA